MRPLLAATAALLTACGAGAPLASPAIDAAASELRSPSELARHAEEQAATAERVCRAPSASADCPDYRPALATLEQLLRDHPDAPEATASLETVGFYRASLGRDDAARVAWLALVCPQEAPDPLAATVAMPPSNTLESTCAPRPAPARTIFHGWLRLGEHLFDFAAGPDDLERAAAAYRRAIDVAPDDAPHLAVARYKLAWTLYRLDRFADAFAAFAAALDTPSGDDALHREAIQYMAIIATEEDWDLDATPDGVEPLARPAVAAWLARDPESGPDLLVALGATLSGLMRHGEAVAVYEAFLGRYPGHGRREEVNAALLTARARCAGGSAPGFTCGVGAAPSSGRW